MSTRKWLILLAAGLAGGSLLYYLAPTLRTYRREGRLLAYLRDPAAHPDWQIQAGTRCGEAPFLLPTSGYLGYGYGDSWKPGHRHQGIDIFGPAGLNQTPVLAVHPGYLTRLPDWKSTVILRVPQDPLQPDRQIWVYYTHLADPEGEAYITADFPPGTVEKYVAAGTLLGYQGNFSGTPGRPVGVHLHFSIVRDDGQGHFKNELKMANTLDPSPYLGLAVNANADRSQPITCSPPKEK